MRSSSASVATARTARQTKTFPDSSTAANKHAEKLVSQKLGKGLRRGQMTESREGTEEAINGSKRKAELGVCHRQPGFGSDCRVNRGIVAGVYHRRRDFVGPESARR